MEYGEIKMETKDSRTKKNKNRIFYIMLLMLIVVLFAGSFIIFHTILNQNVITKGVFVNGIDLSGLTKEKALTKLQSNLQKFDNIDVSFKYNQKEYIMSKDYINISYDKNKMINEAYAIGKSGNILKRLQEIYKISKNGVFLKYKPNVDYEKINGFVSNIAKDIDRKPIDAKISINNGKVNITNDVSGQKVDIQKTVSLAIDKINKMIDSRNNGKINVNIAVASVNANIRSSLLSMIKSKIVSYSTPFNPGDTNRSGNLSVAAKAISGKLLMPGGEFSLNKALGPRIIQNGYKEAPVIVGNKLVPDIGGGVCQVATTLYNAVLRADLKIDERYHHTFPVGYVSVGQDATISGDVLDLKFENQTQYPILLESYTYNNNFIVNLYGYQQDPGKRIDIYSQIVETYVPKTKYVDDPTLPEGQQVVDVQKHIGYKVNTYRLIYKNNVIQKKEFLYTDIYKPVDEVIKRGTKKEDTQTNKDVNPNSKNGNNTPTNNLNGRPQTINPT